jgi:hypothetical protein
MWKGMTVDLRMNGPVLLPVAGRSVAAATTMSVRVHVFRHFVLTTMTLLLTLQNTVLPLKLTRQISIHTASYMAPSAPPPPPVY